MITEEIEKTETEAKMTEKGQMVYFVSYSHSRGFGNVEVNMEDYISSVDTVRQIAEKIETELKLRDVVIITFFPIRIDPEDG